LISPGCIRRAFAVTVIQPVLMPSLGDGGAVIDAGQYENQMQSAAPTTLRWRRARRRHSI
jgi:hypothetical protein